MGRLQRKKTARKKKTKKTEAIAPSQAQTAGAAQGAVSGSVAKDSSKKYQPARKKPSSIAKAPATRPGKNYLGQALQFLREVKVELKKVTWPTRKQTLGSTAVVIVLVMIISLFLGLVDIGLSSLIRVILQ